MTLSLDALNSRVAQLARAEGGDIPLFLTDKPLFTALRKIAKPSEGLRIMRHLNLGSPNEGTNLTGDGFDIAPAGNSQVKDSYEMDYWQGFCPIQLPQKVLDESDDGEGGADEVIKDYIGSTVETIYEDLEYWMLTGAVRSSTFRPVFSTAARLTPMNTFNGAVTWTGVNGTDKGLCELVVKASQSGNVQGLAKSALHANQYQVGTGWAAGTTEQSLNAVISQVRNFAGGPPVDMGFADSISHAKASVYLRQNVLVDNVSKDQGTAQNFITYKGVKIFDCNNLDTENAAYTGTTAASASAILGGVIYFIASKRMEFRLKETKSPEFKDISTNQAVLTAKMLMRAQLIAGRLPAVGAIAGTRIP